MARPASQWGTKDGDGQEKVGSWIHSSKPRAKQGSSEDRASELGTESGSAKHKGGKGIGRGGKGAGHGLEV